MLVCVAPSISYLVVKDGMLLDCDSMDSLGEVMGTGGAVFCIEFPDMPVRVYVVI